VLARPVIELQPLYIREEQCKEMECCRRYCQRGCRGYGRTWSKGATLANPSWSWTLLAKARDDDWWHCL
jgi:hypothetical protein